MAVNVLVIGGGIAGLTAAHELAKNGLNPVLLESSARVGGFIAPLEFLPQMQSYSPLIVDAGAESFATRSPIVRSFVEGLGLPTQLPDRVPAWCFPVTGDPFELPTASVLGIPTDPHAPGLAQAISAGAIATVAAEPEVPAHVADRSNLASFVRSRMGSEVVERLVRPVAGGVHSAAPENLDVTVLHPNFWELYEQAGSLTGALRTIRNAAPAGSAVAGISGGIHTMVGVLADRIEALGGEIRTNSTVTALSKSGPEWQVTVRSQSGESSLINAKKVVLALPAKQAYSLVEPASAAVDQIGEGTDIALVTLLVRAREVLSRGTGALMAPGGNIAAKGTTHVNRKWPWVREALWAGGFSEDSHVFRFSYGRNGEPVIGSDAALVELAVADLNIIYAPSDLRIEASCVVRWPDALVPNSPELRIVRERFAAILESCTGLYATGSWISGTGIASVIPHAIEIANTLSDKPSFN